MCDTMRFADVETTHADLLMAYDELFHNPVFGSCTSSSSSSFGGDEYNQENVTSDNVAAIDPTLPCRKFPAATNNNFLNLFDTGPNLDDGLLDTYRDFHSHPAVVLTPFDDATTNPCLPFIENNLVVADNNNNSNETNEGEKHLNKTRDKLNIISPAHMTASSLSASKALAVAPRVVPRPAEESSPNCYSMSTSPPDVALIPNAESAMSEEEKIMMRKERNRQHARLSRSRQKEYIASLEQRVIELSDEKCHLEEDLNNLNKYKESLIWQKKKGKHQINR